LWSKIKERRRQERNLTVKGSVFLQKVSLEYYNLNLATGKFGVCATYRICKAPELQTYIYIYVKARVTRQIRWNWGPEG